MTGTPVFESDRKGSGTREWSEWSHNVAVGCRNNCRYCYARYNAVQRFGLVKSVRGWPDERIKPGIRNVQPKRKPGVIMMPTTHDITPGTLNEIIYAARGLLGVGNSLLLVTKPRLECVQRLCEDLAPWKPQVLWRFTIGTVDDEVRAFWEPGAPAIDERLASLRHAHAQGWRTSVSAEPLLGGYDTAITVVDVVEPYVTDTIWIGPMNRIRQRVAIDCQATRSAVQHIEHVQCKSELLRIYDALRDRPKVRFKDAITRLVSSLEGA